MPPIQLYSVIRFTRVYFQGLVIWTDLLHNTNDNSFIYTVGTNITFFPLYWRFFLGKYHTWGLNIFIVFFFISMCNNNLPPYYAFKHSWIRLYVALKATAQVDLSWFGHTLKMLGCFNPTLGQIWTNSAIRLHFLITFLTQLLGLSIFDPKLG